MKLKKILLIDDDDTVNFINRKMIEKWSMADSVVAKNNARQALEELQRNLGENDLPEIIFVDINMPDMTGWEFIQKLTQLGVTAATTKIILLTSLVNPADVDRASKIDLIVAFKEKPITVDMLDEIERDFGKK